MEEKVKERMKAKAICYLCGEERETEKRNIYDPNERAMVSADLCQECSDLYDDGGRNPNQEFN